MAILAVKTDRMDITLNLSGGYIFVQQKWRYNWLLDPNYPELTAWTLQEKRDFHNKSDQLIWKLWSSKVYAFMTGNSSIAQQYRGSKFPINVDVKWVIGVETEHWNVNVYKIPAGEFRGSRVNWISRRIELDSEDKKPRTDAAALGQIPVTHEIGHALGNSRHVNPAYGDEYPATSLHHTDRSSIMNIGVDIRIRHFNYLKEQLNLLLPSAAFDISI